MMDMNQDGQLTVSDFVSFVGKMGGVQRLFELRRQRVATSRRDVVSAVSVGSVYFHLTSKCRFRFFKHQEHKWAAVSNFDVRRKLLQNSLGIVFSLFGNFSKAIEQFRGDCVLLRTVGLWSRGGILPGAPPQKGKTRFIDIKNSNLKILHVERSHTGEAPGMIFREVC